MTVPPRTQAYLQAYALWDELQGPDHAQAAARLLPLQRAAEQARWSEAAFVARAARAAYAVLRPDGDPPELAALLAAAAGAPAFTALALALAAVDAGARGDTEQVLGTAGRAVALLDDATQPALDRCTAYVVCAAAYNSLSLWELVDELYESARALLPDCVVDGQAAAVSVNRVLIRAEWATSLLETGDQRGGAAQLARALQAARESRDVVLPPLWRRDVEAVETAVALLQSPSDDLLEQAARQRAELVAAGDVEAVPLLDACRGLALHRLGRPGARAAAEQAACAPASASTGARSFTAWARAQVVDPQAWEGPVGDYARLVARQRWQARTAVLVAARAVTSLERLQGEHRRLAADLTRDALTGLGNRRAFEQWLARAPARGECAALLLVDLDAFKQVNDVYGHSAGDEVLRRVGRLIAEQVRPGDLACRQGGDEFVVVLEQTGDDGRAALDRARELRRRVAEHDWRGVAPGLRVAVSVGAAAGPLAAGTATLYRRADAALYLAKSAADGVVLEGADVVVSLDEGWRRAAPGS